MAKLGLKARITVLTAMASVVSLSGIGYLSLASRDVAARTERDNAAVMRAHQNAIASKDLGLLFRSEVQAWKNTLLRGTDAAKKADYLKERAELRAKAEASVKGLVEGLDSDEEKALVSKFLDDHANLNDKYDASAAENLREGAFDPTAADAAVKGLDRKVLDSLDALTRRLSERMEALSLEETQRAAASVQRGMAVVAALSLAIGVIIIALVSRITGRMETSVHALLEKLGPMDSETASLLSGAERLSDQAGSGASSLEEIVSTVEMLVRSGQALSQRSQEAAGLAEQASAFTDRNVERVGEIVREVSGLAEESARVREIIAAIESLAFQTNLLALNAAVEAARAGEHGKGFAVVAGAVQDLAQKSSASSKDITARINATSTKAVNSARSATESRSDLEAIRTRVSSLAEIVRSTAEEARSQGDAFREIGTTLGQIDALTQGTAELARTTSDSCVALRALSEGIRSEAGSLEEILGRKAG